MEKQERGGRVGETEGERDREREEGREQQRCVRTEYITFIFVEGIERRTQRMHFILITSKRFAEIIEMFSSLGQLP